MNADATKRVSPAIGEFAIQECERLRQLNKALSDALAGMCRNRRTNNMPLTASELKGVEVLRDMGIEA